MTKKKQCTHFEEMLMWTSYRYCIGRKTYVSTMAHEMAQYFYDRLPDVRMEQTAEDIRREIYDKLRFLPFEFHIHRIYNSDPLNPIDALMNFIQRENIQSWEELSNYASIEYNANDDEYVFEKQTPTLQSYFSASDIEDLLPWNDLASCFDKKNHKMVTTEYKGEENTYRCFKSWKRKCIPCEDKPDYYMTATFGWEPVWVDLDTYLSGDQHKYLNNDYIKKIEDCK